MRFELRVRLREEFGGGEEAVRLLLDSRNAFAPYHEAMALVNPDDLLYAVPHAPPASPLGSPVPPSQRLGAAAPAPRPRASPRETHSYH